MLSYQFKKAKFSRSLKSSLETKNQMKMSLKICMDLSPIAFHDKLGGEMKIFNLFVEKPTSINIIWDLILLWFRFFGEPEGLHKCYFSEFKRLDKLLPNIQRF